MDDAGRPSGIPGGSITTLSALVRRLLAENGCAWDRKQTLMSLRVHVLEEASELVDAIERSQSTPSGRAEDRDEPALLGDIRDELGDLIFLLCFVAELLERAGGADLDGAVASIVTKLRRRHPHVFDPEGPQADWETIKQQERAARGEPEGRLPRVPRSLEPLMQAQALGVAAASTGFDWPDRQGPEAQLREELIELEEAVRAQELGVAGSEPGSGQAAVLDEAGDVLFSVVNLCRHLNVDAAEALRSANRKFRRRFGHVEMRDQQTRASRSSATDTTVVRTERLRQLEAFWAEAKQLEKP